MSRILLSITLLVACFASDARACNRCGLLGNRCRYYKPTYYAPAYQPVAVVKSPDVFVVQNNYPQPIAAQGNTVYGYQTAVSAYAVNPAELFRQAQGLAQASTATTQLAITGFNQMANTQLTLQAQITEPLARGHAASQVLSAAGLSQPFNQQQQQSLALRIYSDTNGQWKVEQQVNAQIEASVGNGVQPVQPAPTRDPPSIPSGEQSNSMVAQKCARCHGLTKTEPKGGVFLDAGHRVNCDIFREAIRRIKSNDPAIRMPPDGGLTPLEAGELLDELIELSKPS
jgi:hypothetical protein